MPSTVFLKLRIHAHLLLPYLPLGAHDLNGLSLDSPDLPDLPLDATDLHGLPWHPWLVPLPPDFSYPPLDTPTSLTCPCTPWLFLSAPGLPLTFMYWALERLHVCLILPDLPIDDPGHPKKPINAPHHPDLPLDTSDLPVGALQRLHVQFLLPGLHLPQEIQPSHPLNLRFRNKIVLHIFLKAIIGKFRRIVFNV